MIKILQSGNMYLGNTETKWPLLAVPTRTLITLCKLAYKLVYNIKVITFGNN